MRPSPSGCPRGHSKSSLASARQMQRQPSSDRPLRCLTYRGTILSALPCVSALGSSRGRWPLGSRCGNGRPNTATLRRAWMQRGPSALAEAATGYAAPSARTAAQPSSRPSLSRRPSDYESDRTLPAGPVQHHRGCSGARLISSIVVLYRLVVVPGLPERLPPCCVRRSVAASLQRLTHSILDRMRTVSALPSSIAQPLGRVDPAANLHAVQAELVITRRTAPSAAQRCGALSCLIRVP